MTRAVSCRSERKDFLPSEIDAIRRALAPVEKVAAKERQREHGGTTPGVHSGKVSPGVAADEPQRARDKIGAFAGVSEATFYRQVESDARPTITALAQLHAAADSRGLMTE